MKRICLIFLGVVLMQCSVSPEQVEYAKDPCQFCKMTIMEPGFAAELVNTKGRSYKFDDISCMIKYMKMEEQQVEDYAFVLVNEYATDQWIDAANARYIHHENLRSPMQGNTAAFKSKIPEEWAQEPELNWNELWEMF